MSRSDRVVVRLQVSHAADLSPRMRRLTLTGPDAGLLDGGRFDDRVKVVFPDSDAGGFRPPRLLGDRLEWPRPFPQSREYTIRRVNRTSLDIDFVLHEGGLAADWARTASRGADIWLVGPRSDTAIAPETESLILLGDETALPAIARCLEELDGDRSAHVAIEVFDAREEQALAVRGSSEVTWLHRRAVGGGSPLLGRHLTLLGEPPPGTYLWAAGEAGAMKPIRHWARRHGFDRTTCNISGYWRARSRS